MLLLSALYSIQDKQNHGDCTNLGHLVHIVFISGSFIGGQEWFMFIAVLLREAEKKLSYLQSIVANHK